MYRYEIIVFWSDEDGAYIAEAPELSGCMTGLCEEPAGDEAI